MKRFLFALLMLCTLPLPAWAQTPDRKLGGCSTDGVVCVGPAASFSLVKLNLSDDTMTAGLIPGVGYGVTYWANEWYNVGASLFLEVVTGDGPSVVAPAFVASFAEYLRVGVGFQRTSGDGTETSTDTLFLFGLGVDLGATPGLGIVPAAP